MFRTRFITAAIALPLFAAALFLLPRDLWALFLLVGLAIGAWEWAALASYARTGRIVYAAVVVASALALYFACERLADTPEELELGVFALSCVFWVAAAPFWLGTRWKAPNSAVLAIAGWIALVPMWLALVRLQATPWALLTFMSIVWIADTAAYLAGKRWGKHKLAPLISPGKTWEGAAGAAVAVALYYLLLYVAVGDDARYFEALFGLLVFIAIFVLSVEGDLFESLLKRQAGVKDSGQLLPGHGGILDRIDGLTATMPAAALAFYLR
jgi:phosphatidate cytidylyltransferase